jgi:putative two-component system response regulator
MIRHHHERYDGTGHPDGLAGDDIPLGARIISIADTFDAMTSARPYREGMKVDVALKIMGSEISDGQWDPSLLKTFIKMKSREKNNEDTDS